ncbi:hypothetical protein CCP1ISM_10540001 [Azospirillaceae bacterium]
MYDATGKIYIPLEEFWAFINKYHGLKDTEIAYGVPHVEGNDLVISYAASSECHPSSWAEKPECLKEWEKKKE